MIKSSVSTKVLSSTNVYNVDNNHKYFFGFINVSKSAYQNDFEGSQDTEDWSNGAKKSVLPSQEYMTFYTKIVNSCFKLL